jgi:hypothetical protein
MSKENAKRKRTIGSRHKLGIISAGRPFIHTTGVVFAISPTAGGKKGGDTCTQATVLSSILSLAVQRSSAAFPTFQHFISEF